MKGLRLLKDFAQNCPINNWKSWNVMPLTMFLTAVLYSLSRRIFHSLNLYYVRASLNWTLMTCPGTARTQAGGTLWDAWVTHTCLDLITLLAWMVNKYEGYWCMRLSCYWGCHSSLCPSHSYLGSLPSVFPMHGTAYLGALICSISS